MIVERRIFKRIEQYLFKSKIIAIYGTRQVGKITQENFLEFLATKRALYI